MSCYLKLDIHSPIGLGSLLGTLRQASRVVVAGIAAAALLHVACFLLDVRLSLAAGGTAGKRKIGD
jgi:hypothetical protein